MHVEHEPYYSAVFTNIAHHNFDFPLLDEDMLSTVVTLLPLPLQKMNILRGEEKGIVIELLIGICHITAILSNQL